MKNKSFLLLLEQMCMILLFALAAALTLRGFALSGEMTRESRRLSDAALMAQNMAEVLKQTEGDPDRTAALLGGTADSADGTADSADRCVVCTDPENRFTLTARITDTENPLLGTAEIRAVDGDGTLLYSLTVCWQKEESP